MGLRLLGRVMLGQTVVAAIIYGFGEKGLDRYAIGAYLCSGPTSEIN